MLRFAATYCARRGNRHRIAWGRLAPCRNRDCVPRHDCQHRTFSDVLRCFDHHPAYAFNAKADLTERVVSVFQVQRDPAYPVGDVVRQLKYIGIAPSDTGKVPEGVVLHAA
jgi:hypothetical protein